MPTRCGEGGERVHRYVRSERMADSAHEHGPRETGAIRQGDARGPHRRRSDAIEPGDIVQPGVPNELPGRWQLDARPGPESAFARRVRRIHSWCASERMHTLVTGVPGNTSAG